MEAEKYTLVGVDGNAYAIIGYVINAMKREHFTKDEIDAYIKDATSSDYTHLICVSIIQIDYCNEKYNNRITD